MRDQIECVGEESRCGILVREEGHQDELDDVEKNVDRKEGADRDVEAVSKFQHLPPAERPAMLEEDEEGAGGAGAKRPCWWRRRLLGRRLGTRPLVVKRRPTRR